MIRFVHVVATCLLLQQQATLVKSFHQQTTSNLLSKPPSIVCRGGNGSSRIVGLPTTTLNGKIVKTTAPMTRLHASTMNDQQSTTILGPRLSINENYPGLNKIYTNPDIFIVENFLSPKECADMIKRANDSGKLSQSPVAYAGWTQDFQDLMELAIKGPVSWFALIGAWVQVKDNVNELANPTVSLVVHALQNFSILLVVAIVCIGLFTKSRADGLQQLRTSTSTILDDLSDKNSGTIAFVEKTAKLFGAGEDTNKKLREEAGYFEAPTVIRYEPDQVLAPHFDANRSANQEDTNRGGQTLATLLVYLNDVERGGLTRFGRLPSKLATTVADSNDPYVTVQPKVGDGLLFFPADNVGNFDERTEHEGCPAIDEKWIARIWRHQYNVPPPFGLSNTELSRLS